MGREKWQCMVCGVEADPEVIAAMVTAGTSLCWVVHRIDKPAIKDVLAGVVQVMTCPNCNHLTQDLILESYKERIRHGLVPGLH